MRSIHSCQSAYVLLICCLFLGLASTAVAEPQLELAANAVDTTQAEPALLVNDSVFQSIAGLGGEGGPAPVAAACTASLNCGDGNVISCNGNSSCFSQHFGNPDYVECDGQRTTCPNACVAVEICDCGGTLTCSSNSGDCQTGDDTVTCDGSTISCPNFCQGGGFGN